MQLCLLVMLWIYLNLTLTFTSVTKRKIFSMKSVKTHCFFFLRWSFLVTKGYIWVHTRTNTHIHTCLYCLLHVDSTIWVEHLFMVSESRVHLKAGKADPQKRRHDLRPSASLYSVKLQHRCIMSKSRSSADHSSALQIILTIPVKSIPGFYVTERFQQKMKVF